MGPANYKLQAALCGSCTGLAMWHISIVLYAFRQCSMSATQHINCARCTFAAD